jgi:hypothetical protein
LSYLSSQNPAAVFTATGGTIANSGGFRYHTFTTSGTFTVSSGSANVEVILIAGGGSGGGRHAGGGGAGGLLYQANVAVNSSTSNYTITIGAGGAATATISSGFTSPAGNVGGNTTGFGFTSFGGGGGAGRGTTGQNGGSGGGGCTNDANQTIAGGTGQFVVGSYNIERTDSNDVVVIGAGTSSGSRSNIAVFNTGGVAIGGGVLNASAILDVASTSKGVIFPRMTQAQRSAIVSPATGLIVYCTDAPEGLFIKKSGTWVQII